MRGGQRGDTRLSQEVKFDLLYRDTFGAVLGYCLRRSPSLADAEDRTAEVFLVAWRKLDEVSNADAPLAWLYAVAFRSITNQRRSITRAARLKSRLRELTPSSLVSNSVETDHEMTETAALEAAEQVLGGLSSVDREIICLGAWEQLSTLEISRVVGLSEGAVRARRFRIRQRLSRDSTSNEEFCYDR